MLNLAISLGIILVLGVFSIWLVHWGHDAKHDRRDKVV